MTRTSGRSGRDSPTRPPPGAWRIWSSPRALPTRTARHSSGSPSRRLAVQPRWQPSLDDYIDMAAYLLGTDRAAISKLPRLALAESALHAPFASFGGIEAYPTLVEQAAVLLQHLATNHPLPDANKRAAFLLTARFLDANGLRWRPPDVETDAGLVERVAAGEATHEDVVHWIRERTSEAGGDPSTSA